MIAQNKKLEDLVKPAAVKRADTVWSKRSEKAEFSALVCGNCKRTNFCISRKLLAKYFAIQFNSIHVETTVLVAIHS